MKRYSVKQNTWCPRWKLWKEREGKRMRERGVEGSPLTPLMIDREWQEKGWTHRWECGTTNLTHCRQRMRTMVWLWRTLETGWENLPGSGCNSQHKGTFKMTTLSIDATYGFVPNRNESDPKYLHAKDVQSQSPSRPKVGQPNGLLKGKCMWETPTHRTLKY